MAKPPGMLRGVNNDGPSDDELLAAGGWADVQGVCILAKGWDRGFCAAVVNTHSGDETNPYATIVECFERGDDGGWVSLGHHGPITRGEGSGSYNGRWNYEYGWDEVATAMR